MKEVKSPKKPLLYYYGIVLLVLVLFNVVLAPMLSMKQVKEVDYGTFMSKIEDKKSIMYRLRTIRFFLQKKTARIQFTRLV